MRLSGEPFARALAGSEDEEDDLCRLRSSVASGKTRKAAVSALLPQAEMMSTPPGFKRRLASLKPVMTSAKKITPKLDTTKSNEFVQEAGKLSPSSQQTTSKLGLRG